jgi:hypothetical protein
MSEVAADIVAQTNSAANQRGSLESEKSRGKVNRHMQSLAAPRILTNPEATGSETNHEGPRDDTRTIH